MAELEHYKNLIFGHFIVCHVQYDAMSTMSTTSNNILQLHIPIMSSMPTKNWNLWKSEIPQISKKPSGTPGVLQLVIGFLQTGACNLGDGHICTMNMSNVHVHKYQVWLRLSEPNAMCNAKRKGCNLQTQSTKCNYRGKQNVQTQCAICKRKARLRVVSKKFPECTT